MTVQMAAPMARHCFRSVSRTLVSLPTCRSLKNTECNKYRCNPISISRGETLKIVSLQLNWLRYHTNITREERRCWKCNSPTNKQAELYFCNCGVVQRVPYDLTYFEAFNFPVNFDIDSEKLPELYKQLQKGLHPDFYSQKSKEEQEVAANQSAFINKAYTTLQKPLSRGLYLLELKGDPLDEKNNTVAPEFLMEIMEINEELTEVMDNHSMVIDLEKVNSDKIDNCVSEISKAFSEENIVKAKGALIRLKYYCNIDEKIKEVHRSKMDHH